MSAAAKPTWERIADDVERFAVSGGWLYRTCSWVELPHAAGEPRDGYYLWSDPVFAPEVRL